MSVVWSSKKLSNLLYDFYLIAGVRVGFFDVDGREIVAHPANHSPYCKEIRLSSAAQNECLKCDNVAYQHAKTSSEPYMYRCHAGLVEMVVPIKENNTLLGFLMMGQIRTEPSEKLEQNFVVHLKNMGLNAEMLKDMFNDNKVVEVRMLEAYARILKACSAYVLLEKCIRLQDEPLVLGLDRFIRENLSKPLNIPFLCNNLTIGKTTLCKQVKQEFNLTVTELIRLRRVEAAREMLQKSDYTIAEVSEQVGISDYNYFTKIFKKQTGVTPSTYRRLCEHEALELSQGR